VSGIFMFSVLIAGKTIARQNNGALSAQIKAARSTCHLVANEHSTHDSGATSRRDQLPR
jgi:hypothetical protein